MKRSLYSCVVLCSFLLLNCVLKAQSLDWKKLQQRSEHCLKLINKDLSLAELLSDSLLQQIQAPYDSLVLSKIYAVKANVCFKKGTFDESVEYNLKALEIRELLRDSIFIASSCGNLGNVYYYANDLEKGVKYHQRAIEIRKRLKEGAYLSARNYNTIALIYLEESQYDSSRKYFQEGIQSCMNAPEEYQKTKGILYSNKATLEEETGNVNQALQDLDDALKIHQKLGRISSLGWTNYRLGALYLDQEEWTKSLHYLKIANEYTKNSSTLDQKRDIQYSLFQCYLMKGEKDSALLYSTLYSHLNDSVFEAKAKQNIFETEAKYQVEKKEAELLLSEEKSARLNAEKDTKQYYLYWAFTGIAGLLFLLFFGYRHFKNQRRLADLELEIKDSKLDELLSNQESKTYASVLRGQEKERERIAQDLHDRLGGTLAALKHTLRKPENKIDPEDLKIVDQAVLEVRGIAHNLSTGLVSKYGLNEALGQLFRTIEKTGGITFNLYIHPKISSLGQAVGMELYRIVQELVSNTLKHADATEVSLQTNFDIGSFNFIFEDNGKGFDPEKTKGGIGLGNIQARVDKLGGDLHIDTQPGRGTIVIIELKHTV